MAADFRTIARSMTQVGAILMTSGNTFVPVSCTDIKELDFLWRVAQS
jgi:hypothetical protein